MDANMMADGVISLDDRPAIAAIDRANKGLDSHEAKTKTVLDRAGREWQVYGENVVRVSDRGKTSLDRLLQSMEKQASMAGKSGTDRLIAERDLLIKKWQDEEKAVQAITKAYDKMISAESGGGGGRWKEFADGAKNFIANPLQSIGGAAGSLLEKLGPVWSAVGAGVAVLGSVAVAGWEAAKSLANYGLEIKNVELRTGLSTKEVEQFGFAARMAGQDASIYERMMRGLSQAADENSKDGERARKTLTGMGVDLRSVTGDMKPTSQLLLEISAGLAKLPEGMQRDAAAMGLFKRAGIEAIPVISGLAENVKRAKEIGLGATDEDLQRWEQYHEKVTEAEVLWERFTRKIKEPLAALVTVIFSDKGGHEYTLEDLQKRGVNLGQWAPRSDAQNREAAAAAGFVNPDADRWRRNIATDSALGFTDKIEARKRGDAAVLALQAQEGLAGKLKEAEAALGKMTKPEVGVSSAGDVSDYSAAMKKVETLKAEVEGARHATEDLKKFRTDAAEFARKGNEAELGAIQKIYFQRDLLIKQAEKVKASEGAIAGVRRSAAEQAMAAVKRDVANSRPVPVSSANPTGLVGVMSPDEIKEWEKAFGEIRGVGYKEQADSANKNAKMAAQMVGLSGATGMDAIRANYQIRVNLAKQLADIEAERISKETNAADQLKDMARARAALEKDIAEAQQEATLKQLELQKQQLDVLKKDMEGLWHTLLTNPSRFPKQLGNTVHEAILKPVTDGLAGMSANVLKPIIYGPDGNGGLSGIFKGIFGGGKQDPMKVATDLNTAVTAQNSAALATLTAILAGAMGMAAPAIAAPAGIGGFSVPAISVSAPSLAMPPISFGGGASVWSPGAGGDTNAGSGGAPMMAAPASGGMNPLAMLLGGGRGSASGQSGLNISGILKNFKGTNWGGFTRADAGGTPGVDGQAGVDNGAGAINGVSGVAGAALTTGGMMLASQGLLGSSRGTWGGVAMGTAGGAAIGFQMGGPLGAAIGAGAGLLIGLGEKLFGVESPENEAKRLVKQLYGVNIDTATAKQIVSIAQSKYAGHVSVAVRDPDVRKILELYAQGTGQRMPLSASTPRGGSLVEQGGNLYQQASYQYGQAYAFQSQLPVTGVGGGGAGTYPNPGGPNSAAGMGPMSVSLNISGADAASFMTGQFVTPQFVTDQSMAAQGAGYNRNQQYANMSVPGLTVGT